MAMSTSLLSGAKTEWSLVRRHESEKFYGVQLAGAHANACASAAQVVAEQCMIDFVDINVGCPIDSVCSKGAGSALLSKIARLQHIVRTVKTSIQHTNVGVTVKLRSGISDGRNVADTVIETLVADGCVDAITLHGRTREQRYTRACDWEYMRECAKIARAAGVPLIGCGDVLSHDDYYKHLSVDSPIDSIMIGRGALIKPWIFKEIKEQRIWDITANERLDVLRTASKAALENLANSLEYELQSMNSMDVIVTRIYPAFIRTQLVDGGQVRCLDNSMMNAMTVEYVAELAVYGILRNRRRQCMPKVLYSMYLLERMFGYKYRVWYARFLNIHAI